MRKLDALWGSDIHDAIRTAIVEARTHRDVCEFDFNGVNVRVAGDSNPDLIYRDWQRGMNRYLGENPLVGPYPSPTLSYLELATDQAIKEKNEAEAAKLQAEYEEQARQQALVLQGALSVAPPFDVADEAAWEKCKAANRDGYGGRVVRYAEEWGRLMQTRLANGEAFEDFADETSHLADDDGITGFMYGAAVSILAKVWRHGEELRRWHNLKTQIGSEGAKANESGGVLNPALLNVSR